MRADLIANNGRARRSSSISARRPNSAAGGLRQRLGLRRPTVGGAAERVAQRRRGLTRQQPQPQLQQQRARSRSRGRARSQSRGGDQSRGRSQSVGRSQSRGRRSQQPTIGGRTNGRVGGRVGGGSGGSGRAPGRVSVKQRLGVRAGVAAAAGGIGAGSKRRSNRRGNSQMRGVAAGRIEKRRNSNAAQKTVATAAGRGRKGRARGR